MSAERVERACLVCGRTVPVVNYGRENGREVGYLGRHWRPGISRDAKCSGSFGGWVGRALNKESLNTPAGGHAPEGGAAGTAADGSPQREVAPVPPAGRTIEAIVGIRPDCPTCTWPNRETVDMVCQTCGFDYRSEVR